MATEITTTSAQRIAHAAQTLATYEREANDLRDRETKLLSAMEPSEFYVPSADLRASLVRAGAEINSTILMLGRKIGWLKQLITLEGQAVAQADRCAKALEVFEKSKALGNAQLTEAVGEVLAAERSHLELITGDLRVIRNTLNG